MPWIMNMRDDRGSPFVSNYMQFIERVVEGESSEIDKVVEEDLPEDLRLPENEARPDLIAWHKFTREVGQVYYRLKRDRKTLPVRIDQTYIWVADRFKTILEELEPGKRRYIPIDIRLKDGKTPWPEQYWFMRNEHFLECIVPTIFNKSGVNQSGLHWGSDPQRSRHIYWNADLQLIVGGKPQNHTLGRPIGVYDVVLSRKAIAGAHLWQEAAVHARYSNRHIFLSDEFVSRLRKAKALMGLELGEVRVSDLPASSGRCKAETA